MNSKVGIYSLADTQEDLPIKVNTSPNKRYEAILPAFEENGLSTNNSEISTDNTNTVAVSKNIISDLENKTDKAKRKRSHKIVFATTFLMSIGFSIVLTSVWPYLQQLDPSASKQVLGWVIASNPLGQMIASPILGYISSKFNCLRFCFLVTVFMFTLGNIVYAVLSVFGSYARVAMIVSRVIVGISSANIALCRSYISDSTLLSERTQGQSMLAAGQALGFIVGPFCQTLLASRFVSDTSDANEEISTDGNNSTILQTALSLNFHHDSKDDDLERLVHSRGIEFDMFTSAGWLVAALGLLNFGLFLPCVFQEFNIAKKNAEVERSDNEQSNKSPTNPDYIALLWILQSFLIIPMIFVLLETLAVPMVMDMYAWSDKLAVKIVGISLSILGIIAAIMFYLAIPLARIFSDRFVFLVFGVAPLSLGIVIHVPMGRTLPEIQNCTKIDILSRLNESQLFLINHTNHNTDFPLFDNNKTSNNLWLEQNTFSKRYREHCSDGCPPSQKWCFYTPIVEIPQMIVAYILIVVGYAVSFVMISSIFSKLLGPSDQGFWMGIFTSTGSLCRMIGPVAFTYIYTNSGPRWTFLVILILLLYVLSGNIILYNRLVPFSVPQSNNSQPKRF